MDEYNASQVDHINQALRRLSATAEIPPRFRTSSPSEDVPTPILDSAITTRPPSTTIHTPDTEPANTGGPPSFQVIQVEGHGLGLIAARRIPEGTLILSEAPLIKFPLADESDAAVIDEAFDALSKAERKQYLKLFNAKKSSMSEAAGIYNSNCYDIKAFDEHAGSCIGALSSRVNHSCAPNVIFSYVPSENVTLAMTSAMTPDEESRALKRGLMQFRAIKTISKGKELVGCYEKNIFAPRKTRIDRLQRAYGFECRCEACAPKSDFWEKSDSRRKRMEESVKLAARRERDWSRQDQNSERQKTDYCACAIEALVELEDLLLKEGLSYIPLANCYKSLAKWTARCGQKAESRKWLEKELEVVVRCFGDTSQRALSIQTQVWQTAAQD